MLTRSISNQAMRHSKSFRALVLFGVVALVTAVYQSIKPPSSALTITTGLTPRRSEFKPGPFPLILMRLPAYRESLPEPHPLSVCTIHFGLSPFLCIPLIANRSYASGTAEVATKAVTSWSNALDAPNEDQCGLFDVGAPTYDRRGPLDAPNECTPNEPVVSSPEAFELTDQVRRHHLCTIALNAHPESSP